MRRSAITRRTSAHIVGFLAFTVFALGVAASAAANAGALVNATSLSAPQGGTVTISGNVAPSGSCAPGATVQLTSTPATGTVNLFPNGLGPTVATDASGNFHASIVIPVTTPVGSYSIGVRCGTIAVSTNEILNVTTTTHPPSIAVSPTSSPRGATITISGVVPTTGAAFCPTTDTAELTSPLFPTDGIGPQLARSSAGNFTTTYTIPSTTAAGTYSIGVRCGGGDVGVTASLQVTASVATTTTAPSTTTTTTTTTPVTTVAPAITLPASTTSLAPPVPTKAKPVSHTIRWIALGVLVLVVLAAVVMIIAKRD